MNEEEIVALTQPELIRIHRGDFSVIAVLLQHKNTRLGQDPLYRILKSFVASPYSKSLDDWDRLASVFFLSDGQTLTNFFTEAVLKPEKKDSLLLNEILPFLTSTPEKKRSLQLKCAYAEAIHQEKPFIHAENMMAHYLDIAENAPETTTHLANPLQLHEIRIQLNTLNPKKPEDISCLAMLMGPRIHEAKAKARQFFLNPVHLLMRQCFWLLFHALQAEGQQENPIDRRSLQHLLHSLFKAYTAAYPSLSEILETKRSRFTEDSLRSSLMDILEELKSVMDSDNPLLVDLLFMPTPFHQLQEYRLKNVEQCYIQAEQKRFQAELVAFLAITTETNKKKLQRAFSVQGNDSQAMAETIAQTQIDLADDEQQWLFIPQVQQSVASLFLAHGAKFRQASQAADWNLLKKALDCHIPNNPADELLRKNLVAYCNDESHHRDRFESIRYALKSAHSEKSLAETLLNNVRQKQAFYERNSRLFTLAEKACAMNPHIVYDFLLSVPAFLAPLSPYDFNEHITTYACQLKDKPMEYELDGFAALPDTGPLPQKLYLKKENEKIFYQTTLTEGEIELRRENNPALWDSLAHTMEDSFNNLSVQDKQALLKITEQKGHTHDFQALCKQLAHKRLNLLDLTGFTFTREKSARLFFYSIMESGIKKLILTQPFDEYGHLKTWKNRFVLDYCLRALPYYKQLQALYADNTQLTDETFIPFIQSVVRNKSLEILSIRRNLITDKSLILLSEFIQKNRRTRKWFEKLVELDLSGNLITDTGANALKKCTAKFSNLTITWGNNCALSDILTLDAWENHDENERISWVSSSDRDSRLSERLRPSLTRNSILTRDSLDSRTTSRESSISDDFREKLLRQRSISSEKSGNSPKSIDNIRLSFSTLSENVITETSSALSTKKRETLKSCIHDKTFCIPETILEEKEEDMKGLSQFIEEEMDVEEIHMDEKILTFSAFKNLLESLCTLKKLKKLDISKVTVIPDTHENTLEEKSASLMIQVLVSILPQFEALESVNFGDIEISEEDVKQLINLIPKTGTYFENFMINTSKISDVLVERIYETFSEKSQQYVSLKKSSHLLPYSHNEFIRKSLKPCAIVKKDSIPNQSNWNLIHDNNIDFYYIIFSHPRLPRQLFFVNQEKEATTVKKINYHLSDFFAWLDEELPHLKGSSLFDAVIPLTDEQLLNIRTLIKHNYLEEEKYRLVAMNHYTEEIAIRFHTLESMRSDKNEMENIFFNARQYKQRHDYFYALYGSLSRLIEARSLLSTGLFGSAEQGTLGTYANYFAIAVAAAFPPAALASATCLSVANSVDTMERASLNQDISAFSHKKNEEKEPYLFTLCLLILLKHIHQCEENRLDSVLAKNEANSIVDFLAQQYSNHQSLFSTHDDVMILSKIPELMEILFEDKICILPMKQADVEQSLESLQNGVQILEQGTSCLPMPNTFIVPFGYDCFANAKLPQSLRSDEKVFRDGLIKLAKSYQETWSPKNFYTRCFMKYIQCHGGQESINFCLELEKMAKTLPYYQLLEAITGFLKKIDKKSGLRKGSLKTLLIKALSHQEEPQKVKNCNHLLFFNQDKEILKQQRKSILEKEERLSDSINNRP